MTNSVYILSGVRTPIGDFGGSLKEFSPCDLAAAVVSGAIERSGLSSGDFEQCIVGNVLHTEARDMYISRVASLKAGMSEKSCAYTLNRLCGSGLQAVLAASQMIQLGDVATAVAGGTESMSRAGYLLQSHRWGKRMGDDAVVDTVTGALTDPFGNGHMGVTAENVAREYGVTRSEQDMLAEESHRRAANAQEVGHFDTQIISLPMRRKGEGHRFAHDEHVRSGLSLRDLEALKPVFAPNGTVTAGNASSINDGAAALTLASGNFVEQARLHPIARIVSYGSSGIAPQIMGLGPVDAVKQALERAKLSMSDIDVIEANEAFAAQAIAVVRELDMCPEKVNPNGGAIAMGHPIGATGSIILVKLLHELQRIDGQYGLVDLPPTF